MPYLDFQVNQVLTAAQVDTFLMNQTIMTFADSTARSSALATAATEGMFTFLQDSDTLEYYDGAAWQQFSQGGAGGDFSSFLLMGA